MKKINLFLLTLIVCFNAHAQFVVSGKVLETSGNGVANSQILFFSNHELIAETITDNSGNYLLDSICEGKYLAVVSNSEYEERYDSIFVNQNLSYDFILERKSELMDSVVVLGKRCRQTSKGYVYYLSEKAKKSGNPFVALREIPLLYSDPVDETVRSVDGKSMIVLIDGMRVNTGISPIDPSRIKSVEIQDVVGAKYMRQGIKRILNIKLKKTSDIYTYTQLSSRVDYPKKDAFAQSRFEVGNSKLSLYGDLSLDMMHEKKENSYNLSSPFLERAYAGESKSLDRSLDYSLMLKWRMTDKDYLAIYSQGNVDKETSDNLSVGTHEEDKLERKYSSNYLSHLFSATAYYKHLFDEDQEFEAYAVYTDNRADNTNDISESISGQGYKDNSQKYYNGRKQFSLSLDFSKDFDNGSNLNIGNQTEFNYSRIENESLSRYLYGHHRLNEYLYAGYSGVMFKKLVYNITSGVEYVSMRSKSYNHHYFRPRADLNLTYRISGNINTGINYGFSNSAPSMSSLNPYNTSADTLLVSRGNPYLLPSKTHYVGWNGSVQLNSDISMSGGLSYSMTSDIVRPVSFANDNGVLTTTYMNDDKFRSLDMNFNFYLMKNGYFLLLDIKNEVNYYTEAGTRKAFSTMFLLDKTFGKYKITTTLNYKNYEHTEFSKTKHFVPSSTLTATYSFNPNMILTFGVTGYLGNPRSKTTIINGNYKSTLYTKEKSFTPWILFRWTLRKNNKNKIDLDNDIIRDHEGKIKL